MGVVLFRLLQELSKLLRPLMTAGACTSSFSQLLFLPLLAGFVASEDSQLHVPISGVSELLHVLLLSECHVEGQAPTRRRLSAPASALWRQNIGTSLPLLRGSVSPGLFCLHCASSWQASQFSKEHHPSWPRPWTQGPVRSHVGAQPRIWHVISTQ